MKILSLFSGIGGLELGLERAGLGRTCWQVEQDPFCRQVLARHWPDAQRFEDVCAVTGADFPGCEVICGGFPCQDISLAGKGGGLDGERSGLWREFFRLICEIRPRLIIAENVPALVTRGLERVLCDLAGAGYDAEWEVVSAADAGAPHLRKRVFIIGAPGDTDSQSQPARTQHGSEAPRVRSDAASHSDWWQAQPGGGAVADGIPGRVARLRALGNAVVPQVAELVGRRALRVLADGVSGDAWHLGYHVR